MKGFPEKDDLNPRAGLGGRQFHVSDDQAFWNEGGVLYSMASTPQATPAIFVDNFGSGLAADATDLYYFAGDSTNWHVPPAPPAAPLVSEKPPPPPPCEVPGM